jgi:hypothetical protein
MKWYLFILFMFMVGCVGHIPKERPYKPIMVPVECEDFGRIQPVTILPIKWVIGTDKDGNKVLGLRGDSYSNLSIMLKDSIRYIVEQDKAIDYYKKCIADHNAKALNEKGSP